MAETGSSPSSLAGTDPAAPPQRGVFTIAYGRQKFVEMAKDLGRSLELHAPSVPRGIFTDSDDPELLRLFPYRTQLPSTVNRTLRGYEAKLYLSDLAPFEESLFIDSDCLAIGPIDDFWEKFRDVPIGVCGSMVDEVRHWFVDSAAIRREFNLEKIVFFNGGTYYVRRGAAADQICATARQLSQQFDDLRMKRMRGGIADEPLMSLALSRHGVAPVYDRETPLMRLVRPEFQVDVVAGVGDYELDGVRRRPRILHFCTEYGHHFCYPRERYRLRIAHGGGRLGPATEMIAKARGYWGFAAMKFNHAKTKLGQAARRIVGKPSSPVQPN